MSVVFPDCRGTVNTNCGNRYLRGSDIENSVETLAAHACHGMSGCPTVLAAICTAASSCRAPGVGIGEKRGFALPIASHNARSAGARRSTSIARHLHGLAHFASQPVEWVFRNVYGLRRLGQGV